MTSATPKPRAGEHTPTSAELVGSVLSLISEDIRVAAALDIEAAIKLRLEAERDLLRERERELVEVLETILRAEFGSGMVVPAGCESTYWGKARALLAKHGR